MEIFISLAVIIAIILAISLRKNKKSKKGKRGAPFYTTSTVTHRISSGYNHTYASTATTFYGKGTTLNIKGLSILSPMVYYSENHRQNNLPHVIYNKYKVDFIEEAQQIGYWPSYSSISAGARGQLLKWLAGGKSDPHINIGLVFVYFYGLEFRAIGECKDLQEILFETIRLHKIYGSNNSFRQYSESFIAYLILKIKKFTSEEERALLEFVAPLPPYSSLYKSGAHLQLKKGSISDDNLFHSVAAYENTPRSRIPGKLGALFKDYFLLQSQAILERVKEELQPVSTLYNHYCATPLHHLNSNSNAEGYHLKIAKKTMEKLAQIWKDCIEELKPYSRRLGQLTEEELFLLLPEKMRTQTPHPLSGQFERFSKERGECPCKVGEIAEQLNQEYKERLTLKNSKTLCFTLQELGFGIEPDARYSGKSYKWDETVLFYPTGELEIPKTAGYATATLLFDLGVNISSADGNIDRKELDTVITFVKDNFCTNNGERERIEKRGKLAEAGVSRATGIARKLAEKLKVTELKKVGNYLFMVAAADGVIDSSELKAIRKIFNDFGLGDDYFNAMLNEYKGSHRVEEKAGTGKDSKPVAEERITLDQESLQAILKDTEQVKEILNNVFNSEQQESEEEEKLFTPAEEIAVDTPALPSELAGFIKTLLTKENWEREELHKMALEKKLMLDRAVEEINFWYEEQTGDFLLYEEQNRYIVQRAQFKM